jgi:Fe-S-cluster-containing dehydrogenase component
MEGAEHAFREEHEQVVSIHNSKCIGEGMCTIEIFE